MSLQRLAALVVALVAVLAHLPALHGEFVYDDTRFVVQNSALGERGPWAFFAEPATASAGTGLAGDGEGIVADIYRPLRTLLFAVERGLFGLAPAGWHAVGLLLHALNAVLVLRLLRGLVGGAGPAAPIGALLFAAHPVGVESVAWVSSQGDLLALTLMLLTLQVLERPGAGRTALGASLCFLACLAKESAIVLPGLLWLRDRALPAERALAGRVGARRVALLAGVVAAYFVLRFAVLPGELAQIEQPGSDLLARARGGLAALAWYAGALLWPSGFRFETDLLLPLRWSEPLVVVGAGLLLTLVLLGIHGLRRGRPALVLFAAWGALVALIPVSQVLVPLKTLAAERFLYPVLPCAAAGLAACAVWLGRTRARSAVLGLALLALPWGLVSAQRARAFHDEESLWEAVRADRPSNWRAYEGLGFALLAKGRYQEGERAYSSYLEFNPFDGKARRRIADYLGGLVRTLVSRDPEVQQKSDLARRRSEVQGLQLGLLESALSVWEEVGTKAGRGSEAWVVDTQRELRDVAVDRGDLPRAKRANDWLIAHAGVDPTDPARVAASAPLAERTCRWFLAWVAVTTPPGEISGEPRQQRQQQRASVLADIGLPAVRPDEALVAELEAPLARLRDEQKRLAAGLSGAARATAERRAVQLDLLQAELLERTGRAEEALRLRREVLSRSLAAPPTGSR